MPSPGFGGMTTGRVVVPAPCALCHARTSSGERRSSTARTRASSARPPCALYPTSRPPRSSSDTPAPTSCAMSSRRSWIPATGTSSCTVPAAPAGGPKSASHPRGATDPTLRSARGALPLEVLVEPDRPAHPHLVRRDLALEEVRQLLDVLQLHERQRVAGAEDRLQPEAGHPL